MCLYVYACDTVATWGFFFFNLGLFCFKYSEITFLYLKTVLSHQIKLSPRLS